MLLTMSGLTDKEIASTEHLSIHTVRTYWDRIREKLGSASRAEAIAVVSAEKALRESQSTALNLDIVKHELAASQKQAAVLAAQRAALEEIIGQAPQMTWASWPNGDIYYANERYYTYTGHEPQEHLTVYGTWDELVLPEDRELVEQEVKRNRASGLPVESEVRVKRRDGLYRWHLIRSIPIFDETGREVRWIGTAVDIHDLKERSSSIGNIERRLQLICELAPVGIAYCDPSAGIAYCNDVFARIAGFRLTLENSESRWDWVQNEDRLGVVAAWNDAVERGAPFQARIRFIHADGQVVWAHVRSTPIRVREVGAFVMLVEEALPLPSDEGGREKLSKLAALLEDALEASTRRS